MKKEIEISPTKKYSLPEDLVEIDYAGKLLVIFGETANWIVIENEEQRLFYNLLKQYSIDESISHFSGDIKNAEWVVIQLEAKNFESRQIIPSDEFTCMIYLTNKCNLRCPHCFLAAGEKNKSELTTDEIKKLLQSISKNGIKSVTFTGGEVTTHNEFLELVSFAYSQNLQIQILTNGTLWNEKLIDEISPMVKRIQISIDGYSEEENAKIRGKGNFSKSLKTLERFLQNGVKTEVAITPLPDKALASKIGQYAQFGIDLKQKYIDRDFKILFTSGIMDGRELTLSEKERNEYKDLMNRVLTSYLNEDAQDYPFIITHRLHRIMDNCSYGSLNISSDGNVYMCSRAGMKSVANVRTTSFDKIMEYSKKARRLSNINNLIPCKGCHLKYICGGGCRVVEFESMKTGPAELSSTPIRPCDESIKSQFYDLMIKTNKQIFQ